MLNWGIKRHNYNVLIRNAFAFGLIVLRSFKKVQFLIFLSVLYMLGEPDMWAKHDIRSQLKQDVTRSGRDSC